MPLLPTLAESLAGRMGMLRLYPLAQCELAGRRPRFLDTLPRLLALAGSQTARLIKDGVEVDIVLEHGAGRVTGVEVKASPAVTAADFRGLRKPKDAAGSASPPASCYMTEK